MDIAADDIIKMKKKHPCGGFEWKVLRFGADFRLECCCCGRQVMMPRRQVEKNIKTVTRNGMQIFPPSGNVPAGPGK